MNMFTWDGGIKVIVRVLLLGTFLTVVAGIASAQDAAAPAEGANEEPPLPAATDGNAAATEGEDAAKGEVPAPAEGEQPKAAEGAPTQPAEAASVPAEDAKPAMAVLADEFGQYLHYALIGRFELADGHAQALLKMPEVNPLSPEAADQIVKLTSRDEYKDAVDILLLLINNSSIAENAQKVLDVIRQAHRHQRMNPARINKTIELLAGSPTEQMVAMERLTDSGEYAVPWLIEAIGDARQSRLHPFIVRALPQLGKRILNPMVQALSIPNPQVQRVVAEALGRIGYPQALPYLKRLATDPQANDVVRQAAGAAVAQIVVANPAVTEQPPVQLFADLAEQYYADQDSLLPDSREPATNVWFARKDTVEPIEVPRSIFMLVMCMRSCEDALRLAKDQPGVVALWLAANFRREARLGLDVQTDNVVETVDLTRPKNFLRSVYFARLAGPHQGLLVLERAIKDLDRDVALGSIAALRSTAGPATMIDQTGKTGLSLAQALRFPDLLVRTQAALAMGAAMPAEAFSGADEVVPILASALSLTGQKSYLLVEPDQTARKNIVEGLARDGAKVVAVDRLGAGLTQAHKELTSLDGVFIASDIAMPTAGEAIRQLAADKRFGLAPVVAYIKEGGNLVADQLAQSDERVGRVLVATGQEAPGSDFADTLLDRLAKVAPNYGYGEVNADLSLRLAMESAGVLRDVAISSKTVLNVAPAQKALITALSHPAEPLRMACAMVLARINTSEAQQAIAAVALSDKQTPALRKVGYAALAESARQFGAKLDASMAAKLADLAVGDPDLELRTAASQALGALNLPSRQAADIILDQK